VLRAGRAAALPGMDVTRFTAAARAALADAELPFALRALVDASVQPGFGAVAEPTAPAHAAAPPAPPAGSAPPAPAGDAGGARPGPAPRAAAPAAAASAMAAAMAAGAPGYGVPYPPTGVAAAGLRRHGMDRQRLRPLMSHDLLRLAGAPPRPRGRTGGRAPAMLEGRRLASGRRHALPVRAGRARRRVPEALPPAAPRPADGAGNRGRVRV